MNTGGLTKTKSYMNWKKDNVVDSMIFKENSAMFNLVLGTKIPEDFKSPSLEMSPRNLYDQFYEANFSQA